MTEAFNRTADTTADSDGMYVAIGVGVVVALLLVVPTTVVLTVWCLVKKKRAKSGTYNIYMDYKWGDVGSVVPSSSCGDELKILGRVTALSLFS